MVIFRNGGTMKRISTILLCGILLLGIIGCGKTKNEFKIGEESKTEITSNSDVTLTIKEDSLTNTGVTLLLKNNSEKNYSYGNPYEIEIKQGGKWHKINVELYFTMPSFNLNAGETKEIKLDWENGYGKLGTGTYRIIKSVDYEYEENKYQTFNIAVEFNIDSD